MKLFVTGMFTQGVLGNKAQLLLLASLSRPGFAGAYIARAQSESPEPLSPDRALNELVGQLEKAGIPAEASRRSLAA